MRTAAARAIMFAAASLLAACVTPPAPAPSAGAFALAGTSWQRSDDLDAGPHFPTLDFTADAASGYAGCNTWHAAITADAHALRFGPIAATRMMCPPSSMQTERNFLPALVHTRGYRLEREELVFVDSAGNVAARFTCASETCPHG